MEALVIEGDPTEDSQLSYLNGGRLSIFKTGIFFSRKAAKRKRGKENLTQTR
jgi:hypothetical protein